MGAMADDPAIGRQAYIYMARLVEERLLIDPAGKHDLGIGKLIAQQLDFFRPNRDLDGADFENAMAIAIPKSAAFYLGDDTAADGCQGLMIGEGMKMMVAVQRLPSFGFVHGGYILDIDLFICGHTPSGCA